MATTVKQSVKDKSNPLSALGDALDAASQSISDARADASVSARAAARKVQSGVGFGAYYTAYGVSYGLVFSGVFLKELLPAQSALRRGFEDGADAGSRTAVRLRGGRLLPDAKALEEPDEEDPGVAE
ncbi:MAG: hypothetical protein ABUL77_00165 [Bacteroidota bacterium]